MNPLATVGRLTLALCSGVGEVALFALGVIMDEEMGREVESRLEGVVAAAEPYGAGHYPNFVEEPADARGFWDEATWARLQAVKAQYDPTNMFKGNHYVPPAEQPEAKAA